MCRTFRDPGGFMTRRDPFRRVPVKNTHRKGLASPSRWLRIPLGCDGR